MSTATAAASSSTSAVASAEPPPAASTGSEPSSQQPAIKKDTDSSSASADAQAKRKRPQSCDTCRSRKIKCVRLQVEGLEPGADQRCVQCRAIDAKCTFHYIPKRPGPQSSFARAAKREQQAQAQAQARAQAQAQARNKASDAASRNLSGTQTPSIGFQPPYMGGLDDNWYKAFSASLQQSPMQPPTLGSSARSSSFSGSPQDSVLPVQSPFALTPHFSGFDSSAGFGLTSPNTLDVQNAFPGSAGLEGAASSSQWPSHGIDAMMRKYSAASGMSGPSSDLGRHTVETPQQQLFPFSTGVASSGAGEIRSAPLQVPFPPDSRGQSPSSSFVGSVLPLQSPAHGPETATSAQNAPPHPRASSKQSNRAPALGKAYAGAILRPRSLDDIAPRQTFLSIISLYFHYLWPLLPIVDRPSFSYDLIARRDERDPCFLAFVLSLTSYTLIQAPRTVIPAPWSFYRKLHRICHQTSRRMQPRRYEPPQLLHVGTLYCDHIYLGTTGQNTAANAVLGEAIRVAYALGIHDERRLDQHHNKKAFGLSSGFSAPLTRPPANAVERELRKRLFWVLHGSSTTIALLQDEPAFIRDIDTCVDLPLAVDEDALVTSNIQQKGPSILCGFVTVSRLHQLMSEVLEMYRRDRRYPPSDIPTCKVRLKYIGDILRRIRKVLTDMPEELRKPAFIHQPAAKARLPGNLLPDVGGGPFPPSGPDQSTPQSMLNMQPLPAWPWAADAFTKDGLPNADAASSSSANQSPKGQGLGTANDPGRPDSEPTSAAGSIADSQGFAAGRPGDGRRRLSSPTLGEDASGRGALDFSTMGFNPAFDPRADPTASPATMNVAMEQVNAFRPSPPPMQDSREPVLSPLCTLHANVVVTEAMARFIMVEYRELIAARVVDLKARGQIDFDGKNEDYGFDDAQDGWEAAAKDMLEVLHGMPLEALASNGQSMISKIIYVVSSLLNRTATNTRGYSYMTSFLHMLTRLSQDRSPHEDDAEGSPDSSEDEAEPSNKTSGMSMGMGIGMGMGMPMATSTLPSRPPLQGRERGDSLSSAKDRRGA